MTIFLISIFTFPAFASSSKTIAILDEIPVQHGGRVKPFQTFAQESALTILGSKSYEGLSSSELVWSWISEPQKWSTTPIIPVTHKTVQQEFGLMLIKKRVSPQVVLQHEEFIKNVKDAMARRQKKEPLTPLDRKRIEVYEHAAIFQSIAEGEVPGWIAHPDDPRVGWMPAAGLASDETAHSLGQIFTDDKVNRVRTSLQLLTAALRTNSPDSEAAALEFRDSLRDIFQNYGIALNQRLLGIEMQYNHVRPFSWAWMLYAFGVLITALAFSSRIQKSSAFRSFLTAGSAAYAAGFFIHVYGFVLRCMIAGRPPVTNMYESIIWVSLAVVVFSLIIGGVYRSFLVPGVAGIVASFALMIGQSFPAVLDPHISPLVPVLRSNYWLTIHVLTITMSYGAFALAWGLGHAVVFHFAFNPQKMETNRKLMQYLYRALQIGVILLATGTVLGGVWANYSWGRFWGWDPKETWALIALLGYLSVLHGRLTGWLGPFGVAVGSIVAFLGVLMAWYGVNFVLAAGLHSYGFGGGGVGYVAGVCALDLVILSALVIKFKKSKARLQFSA